MGRKSNRPEYAEYGTVYFIRHNSGSHKIGITLNWKRRSRDLKVGTECKVVCVKQVENPGRLEKILLRKYASHNLPGTEWLNNLKFEQVNEIKDLISDESKGYKQVFKSRKKHMVDLEMSIQDSPELLAMAESMEKEREEKRLIREAEVKRAAEEPMGIGLKIYLCFFVGILVLNLSVVAGLIAYALWPIFLIIALIALYLKMKK